MKDQLAEHARDWLTLALAGLGISFATHEYFGGLFLALAGASFAARLKPERDTRELWVVMLGAFVVSHLAAIIGHIFAPQIPVQLVMGISGFLSRYIARTLLRMGGLIEAKSDRITDRIIDRVLPGGEDK